jgi:hypothetical protein
MMGTPPFVDSTPSFKQDRWTSDLMMSEEHGMLPRYTRSVDAVFKCDGVKFVSTARWSLSHPLLFLFRANFLKPGFTRMLP